MQSFPRFFLITSLTACLTIASLGIPAIAVSTSSVTIATTTARFPTFNSQPLDRQVQHYLQYIETRGVPDLLIVGSSRVHQGLDPIALEQALAERGYANLKVYNFGVNGATAQVVSFILQKVLTPEQLPRVIIWGDGARAFNSGRLDRTFDQIMRSPGYKKLLAGQRPTGTAEPEDTSPVQREAGFNRFVNRFDPDTYFQQFPRVSGYYDGDYRNFTLNGLQANAFSSALNFTRRQRIPVIFVNLPLTDIYLDEARSYDERLFRRWMQRFANAGRLTFYDLGDRWLDRYEYFMDPSHLNSTGAEQVANEIAQRLAKFFEIY